MKYPYLQEKRSKKTNLWTGHLNNLVHLFYPNCCIACTKSLFRYEVDICLKCWHKIPFSQSNTLPFYTPFRDPIFCLSYYIKKSVVHSILHSIKYESNQPLGRKLGQWLGEHIKYNVVDIDLIVPVPIHPKKRILRGYNQAECIAQGIQEVLQKPILPEEAIIKTVYTDTQTKKDQIARWKNTENIFKIIDPKQIKHKNILIVDDVFTTGATYYSLKNSLEKTQYKAISLAVLALTEKR